jgi:hypothetical protein
MCFLAQMSMCMVQGDVWKKDTGALVIIDVTLACSHDASGKSEKTGKFVFNYDMINAIF